MPVIDIGVVGSGGMDADNIVLKSEKQGVPLEIASAVVHRRFGNLPGAEKMPYIAVVVSTSCGEEHRNENQYVGYSFHLPKDRFPE